MEIDDRHVNATPEGIALESVLAGLGSRFAAYAIDLIIQVVVFWILMFVMLKIVNSHPSTAADLAVGGAEALISLVLFIGYFVVSEMLWSGRSIGKRAVGLRVVRLSGQPVGFWGTLLRNVLRVVDFLPALNALGSLLILSTSKNQRLGDLVAGTVVVRERVAATNVGTAEAWSGGAQFAAAAWTSSYMAQGPAPSGWLPPELAHWDVSALPATELALVQAFLNNRAGYTPEARLRLASQLANRVWPYVAGPSLPPPPEQFLEAVITVKMARG